MPPKRAIKKAKVKVQTFIHPFQFRPIPISLAPADIQLDIEVMNALLVAQRAALKRASLERPAAAATMAAPQQAEYGIDVAAALSDVPMTSEDEGHVEEQQQHRQQWLHQQQLLQQQQQQQQQPALPSKLASPSCTFQHQQVLGQHQLAGYAMA